MLKKIFINSILFSCLIPIALRFDATRIPAWAEIAAFNVIPRPVSILPGNGAFILGSGTNIYINPDTIELNEIGLYLAEKMNPATGFEISVLGTDKPPGNGNIYLALTDDSTLGNEGYRLIVTSELVSLEAFQPAGLFRGIQTIRQLLPELIDSPRIVAYSWEIPSVSIVDFPRFEYRSLMLDVARHFQSVDNVKRIIDQIAFYKLNHFHLHLSDDQGWRIEINGWPNLTTFGAQTQVGGDCVDCFYTQAQYTELVNYAAARYITLVPEIEMPGHTNAALSAYPGLNCNGNSPARRTDIEVGYSSLCVSPPLSMAVSGFVNDVISQLSELTPGPYIHIGGDESLSTSLGEYTAFLSYVQAIVNENGKKMIGWEESAQIPDLSSTSVVQFWNNPDYAQMAVEGGSRIVMSPCAKAYVDIKYDPGTPLGLDWCGYNPVQDAYTWNPGTYLAGVSDVDILGVEANLWGETIVSMDDIEYMLWPRLAGLAEIGWSPVENRSWPDYITRLGSHGPRWELLGIDYYPSADVPWLSLDDLVPDEPAQPTIQPTPSPVANEPGINPTTSMNENGVEISFLNDFTLFYKSHPLQNSIILLGFLVLFTAGFWTSKSGRPVNNLRMNIHKFLALGLAAYISVFLFRAKPAANWDSLEVIAISTCGMLALISIITGGLSSLNKQVPLASLLHKILPYLTLLVTLATIWIVVT